MNLIDRYVMAVGKRLPRKIRSDIETELRSTLQDMVEDRSQETGQPVSDKLVQEILTGYGSPAKVAASYSPPQYLIGPQLFPIFTLVLRIVLVVIAVLAGIGLAVDLANPVVLDGSIRPALVQKVVQSLIEFLSSLTFAFGNIVLIFAILERLVPDHEVEEKWTPAQLSEENDPDMVGLGETVAGIVFMTAGLIILNFYPQLLSIRWMQDGEWVVVPWLSEAFFRYLPWINISGLLNIVLNLILLRQGTWRTFTRWLQIGSEVLSIGIAFTMLRGPSLVAPMRENLAGTPLAEVGEIFSTVLVSMVPVTLGITIVAGLIEIVKQTMRLWNKRGSRLPFLQS